MYLYIGRCLHHYRRRGASYVFFLGTATLVMVIGLSTLMVVRIQRRGAEGSNHLAAARFYAQSAIEYGFALINKDPGRGTNLGTGFWATDEAIGDGTFSLEVRIVGRNDSTIKPDDSLELIGTGVSGRARSRRSAAGSTPVSGHRPSSRVRA